jgi:hypothetical protein
MPYGSVLTDVVQSSTTGTPPQFNDGSGTQVGTLCRAWVNFNGVTTATIRASFNVSSVIRNSTGDYTVNFTNAMPDANYSTVGSGSVVSTGNFFSIKDSTAQTVSAVRISTYLINTIPTPGDCQTCTTAIFR